MTLTILQLKKQQEQEFNQFLTDMQVFFAFDNDSFYKQYEALNLDAGEKVIALGGGGYLPAKNKEKYIAERDAMEKRHKQEIKSRKKEIDVLILDTINDYESFYTGDLFDVNVALKPYGITAKQIEKVYKKNLCNFDM